MYAVIDSPGFALQAVLRMEDGLGRRAVVLVDESMTKPLVLDCTEAAARVGVMAGLSVAQAIARCEDLSVRYCSAKAELMAGRVLFDCAYSLSPRVEETGPGLCSIGLAGVNRETLTFRCEEIVSELRGLGLWARMGIAPTPDLALLAAREAKRVMMVERLLDGRADCPQSAVESAAGRLTGDSQPYHFAEPSLEAFLDSLPIAAADPSEGLGRILEQWGIRSVGAFARLSREAVGGRLGMEGLAFWDRVSGREERPLRISEPPTVYEESLEFEYEIDTLEPLLFVIRRFLDQLCLRLRVAGKVADSVRLKVELADIRLEDGERVDAMELTLKVPDPTGDANALFLLVATRLERMDTDAAVTGLELSVEPIDRSECQLGLFETSLKDPHRFTQTLSRIAGIVGEENVGRPRLEATGRPDGVLMERLPMVVSPMKEKGLQAAFGLALRRYRPALAAEVEFRERRPVWIRCAKAFGSVVECRGPWAHSGQWWEPGGWNRVEWDVELKAGGVYRLAKEAGTWWIEGEYD